MQITVENQTNLPNKYVRFIRWKLYEHYRKFNHLHYAHVHLKLEGKRPERYYLSAKLGVPGQDIVIKHASFFPKDLMRQFTKSIHRQLVKTKNN